jgi:hypothetical protein
MSKFCLLLISPFLVVTFFARSQGKLSDSETANLAASNLRSQFYEKMRAESFLSIGSDYSEYEPISDEHPFFLTDDWIQGSIRYNGITYENVPLQFDIRSQKLLTEHFSTGKKIQLVPEHVSWFKVDGHHFVFLNDAVTSGKISSGFYELLVEGKAQLWAAYSKAFQESTVTGKLTVRVDEASKYFIQKDNMFVSVSGKGSTLAALEDKKAILLQELKKNKVNFGRNKPAGLIQAVRLYNSIPQK